MLPLELQTGAGIGRALGAPVWQSWVQLATRGAKYIFAWTAPAPLPGPIQSPYKAQCFHAKSHPANLDFLVRHGSAVAHLHSQLD